MNFHLTPTQKAGIDLLETWFVTALIASLLVLSYDLAQPGPIDWTGEAKAIVLTLVFSIVRSLVTFVKAHYGIALGTALEQGEQGLERRLAVSSQQAGPLVVIHTAQPAVVMPQQSTWPQAPTVPTPQSLPTNTQPRIPTP
jgi:hypothetical protein